MFAVIEFGQVPLNFHSGSRRTPGTSSKVLCKKRHTRDIAY
jgi:hypothetical protein